jgi:hypothetical protein
LASDLKEEIRASDPGIPPEITNDRARDNWRPLLAIADAVGGDWPRLARATARAMASAEPETDSKRTLLLRDLKTIFEERRDRLTSEEIVQALIEMEGRPWAEWRNINRSPKLGWLVYWLLSKSAQPNVERAMIHRADTIGAISRTYLQDTWKSSRHNRHTTRIQ